MSVISFVMGTEVHKETVVEMVREKLPEEEIHFYKAMYIDDLFKSNVDSDLVILDLEAHISLREAVRYFRYTDTKIAVILPDSEVDMIDDYLHFELAGFFSVGMSVDEFVSGIKYIQQGITYVHPIISTVIFEKYKQVTHGEVKRPLGLLTRREWEVLGELVKGYQNEEIAENLNISDKTVKNHITSILGKLGVKDRTNAVLMALKERWFYL